MWGGVVESETVGANSAAAAWGAPAVGPTGGDPSSWMAGVGGGQASWGGGGGGSAGPTTSKTSWDAQQQQSNLVAAAGGQSGPNSWQAASANGAAPVNGWTGSGGGGGGQTNWNTGSGQQQQQQWTGTSPGTGSTWAGVASRHAAAAATAAPPQAPIQQGSAPNAGPVVTTPSSASVRPKGGFDGVGGGPGGVGWGKQIDQGTPWETPRQGGGGGGEGNPNTFGGAPSGAPAAHWSGGGGGGGAGGGGASWNAGGGAPQHSNSGGNINRENSWQNQNQNQSPDGRDGNPSYGGGYGGGKPVRGVGGGGGGSNEGQWGGNGGGGGGGGGGSGGWDGGMQPQHRHSSNSGNQWGNSGGMEMSQQQQQQQREPAANVWTGPPAPQDAADSHMIWTNPYPKKTAQPDKGTSTWGDPNSQGDIKRWKTNNEGDLLPALTVLQPSVSSNVQAQTGAGAGNGNSGMPQAQQQQQQMSTSTTAAWKEPTATPTTPQQQQQPKTPSWNASGENLGQANPSSVSSPTSGAGVGGVGWGDQASSNQVQQQQPPAVTPTVKTPYDRDGIATAGWGGGNPNAKPAPPVQLLTKSCSWAGALPGFQHHQQQQQQQQAGSGFGQTSQHHQHAQGDASRNSIESDGGNVSDDVFSSNPTTPLSAGAGPPGSTLILNKQQPQTLPNGFGPHSGAGNNQSLNQLVSAMTTKLGVQNAQMQNLPYNANAPSMTGGATGRVPQQVLTQQIADQLKAAVRAGLIDIGILHQPLPQETLLRLNQLLQCVPKLDQAQKELVQLQTQAANQPQGLNPAQQQEYQRISNEVKQLRQTMNTLKQAINAQTQSTNGQGAQQQQPPQMRNGPPAAGGAGGAAGGGDGGQSKLEQWKRGSTNGVINGDAGSNGGVFGVGLPGNANDPWSNTPAKRNSGADWPQSPATTPGDMPKSPDKQNDGNKENENQQNGENMNRMPTPVGGSANDTSGGGATGGLVTPTLLDDVPEFTPGKPWQWRDPKELAEDPDATPGSIKRPTLGSVCSVVNPSDFFTGTSPSSIGHLGGNQGPEMMGAAQLAAGISALNFAPNFAGGGMLPSNYYGQQQHKQFDPTKMGGPSGYGQQQGGLGDSWPPSSGMPRASRPPSQMGQPIGGRAPFKHSMSTPQTSATGYMPPYNMGNQAPVQWVVLTNLNLIDEPSLQIMMSRIAPVSSCIYPPGAGFAVVKFKDVSLDKVLPRLQQECSGVGLTIQLAKDDEVSRLIQAVTGQRGGGPPGGPQGAGAGHLFGPPPPPPHHHPGPMGPAIWDAPPPQATGPWGPPPPQAGGMHHHGGGGPFAPHHGGLGDPTMAVAASMAMPPGMHDGLFAPVGHDRHAPF